MNKQKTKIILVGKAASGKDFFKKYLVEELMLKPSVSVTTRPMREGEVDGLDYDFVSDEIFSKMITRKALFEWKKFNNWKYGTTKSDAKTSIVFIFTPEGVRSLPKKFLNDAVVVYFNIAQDVRIQRLKERSDADKLERRLKADEEDFKDFNRYDIMVEDAKYKPQEVFRDVWIKMKGL